jgi:hypothetical protein
VSRRVVAKTPVRPLVLHTTTTTRDDVAGQHKMNILPSLCYAPRVILVGFIILCLSTSCRSLLRSNVVSRLAVSSNKAQRPFMSMACFKRVKLDDVAASSAVIGTHSGSFQADEAMGVWMLQQIPAFRNSKVVRSRDPEGMSSACQLCLMSTCLLLKYHNVLTFSSS